MNLRSGNESRHQITKKGIIPGNKKHTIRLHPRSKRSENSRLQQLKYHGSVKYTVDPLGTVVTYRQAYHIATIPNAINAPTTTQSVPASAASVPASAASAPASAASAPASAASVPASAASAPASVPASAASVPASAGVPDVQVHQM